MHVSMWVELVLLALMAFFLYVASKEVNLVVQNTWDIGERTKEVAEHLAAIRHLLEEARQKVKQDEFRKNWP